MKPYIVFFLISISITAMLTISSCGKEKGELQTMPDCDTLSVVYNDTIKNIISNKCATTGCHVNGGSGNGNFTTYIGVNAKVGNGSFETRVYQTEDMPPAGSAILTECEKLKLKRWLNIGAPNN